MTQRTPTSLLARMSGPRVLYIGIALVFGIFVASTIPGVRPATGYNLLLDGILNNIAYELCAVLCFVRARRDPKFKMSWRFLGDRPCALRRWQHLLDGLRPWARPEPWPTFADALWLSFYPFAFIALLLVVREIADQLPLSVWFDGIVGGLAVAADRRCVLEPTSGHHRASAAPPRS